MFCQNCGQQINEGSAFCPNCGAKVENTAQTVAAVNPAPEQAPVQAQAPVQPQIPVQAAQPVQQPVYTPAQGSYRPAAQSGAVTYPAPVPKKKGKAGKVVGIIFGVIAFFVIIGIVAASMGKKPEKQFYGTWNTSMDLADTIKEKMGETGSYLDDDFRFDLNFTFTFNEDGTYRFDPDEASFNETVASFKKTMSKVMLDYIRDIWPDYAAYGDEELTGIFEDAVGSSMEEYMDDAFKDLSFEEFKKELSLEGNYKVEEGKLFLSSGKEYAVDENIYAVFEIKSDSQIVLSDYINNGQSDKGTFIMPMTLTKAN